MPFYSDEAIEEIRARNDIVDVISAHVRLKQKGKDLFGLCPFHSEKTPSFKVSPEQQLYYCFGCRESGNVYTFLMKYDSLTFPEAVEELADRCGYQLPKRAEREDRAVTNEKQSLLAIQKDAAAYYYKLLRSREGADAYAYFSNRGVSRNMMQKFGLGFAGRHSERLYRHLKDAGYSDELLKKSGVILFDEKRGARDRFWNRAIFPIMDTNRRVIAFGGRVMGDGQPKYLNSSETAIFDKSRTLYGLHEAKRTRRGQMILCEGYMDVIALHQAGFDNAVATLGTALTQQHANLLRRYRKPVCLCYDSDGAGQRAADRGFRILLEAGIASRVIDVRPFKDPDEFIRARGAEAFEERLQQADNAFLHVMENRRSMVDESDPAAQTQFQQELAAELLIFTDELERNNYIRACCDRFAISFDALAKLVNRLGAAKGASTGRGERRPKKIAEKSSDGIREAQKLLIEWLLEPAFFARVSGLVEPEDFEEGVLRRAASAVFDQMITAGKADAAGIVAQFTDAQEQNDAAAIFFAGEESNLDEAALSRAKKEALLRVKKHSQERRRRALDPSDAAGLQRVLDEGKRTAEKIGQIAF